MSQALKMFRPPAMAPCSCGRSDRVVWAEHCSICAGEVESKRLGVERQARLEYALTINFGVELTKAKLSQFPQQVQKQVEKALASGKPLYICGPSGCGKTSLAVAAMKHRVMNHTQRSVSADQFAHVIFPNFNWASGWDRLEQTMRRTPYVLLENIGWVAPSPWRSAVEALKLHLNLYPAGTFITSTYTLAGLKKAPVDLEYGGVQSMLKTVLPQCEIIQLKESP